MVLWKSTCALALSMSTLLLAGCYVEPLEEREQHQGSGNQNVTSDRRMCRSTLSAGCLDGYVVSKQTLFVRDHEFRHALDLSNRFRELISVQGGGEALGLDDYSFKLNSQIDNQNFAQDFEFDLIGEVRASGKVRSDGSFAIHELPEGAYNLRVQRVVNFTLQRAIANEPVAPETLNEPAVNSTNVPNPSAVQDETSVSRLFCATILAEAPFEVRRGERVNVTLDRFELDVTNDDCKGPSAGTALTLDP